MYEKSNISTFAIETFPISFIDAINLSDMARSSVIDENNCF